MVNRQQEVEGQTYPSALVAGISQEVTKGTENPQLSTLNPNQRGIAARPVAPAGIRQCNRPFTFMCLTRSPQPAPVGRFRSAFVVAQSIFGKLTSLSAPFSLGTRFRRWTGRLVVAGAGVGLGVAAAAAG